MWSIIGLDKLSGIIGLASIDTSKVSGESLVTPWALGWVADWSKSWKLNTKNILIFLTQTGVILKVKMQWGSEYWTS